MDTALSEVLVLKLFGAEIATGNVASPPIVVILDIIKHHLSHHLPAGKVLPMDILHFQRAKEAFHTGGVIIAAFRAHAPVKIMTFQQSLIIR